MNFKELAFIGVAAGGGLALAGANSYIVLGATFLVPLIWYLIKSRRMK